METCTNNHQTLKTEKSREVQPNIPNSLVELFSESNKKNFSNRFYQLFLTKYLNNIQNGFKKYDLIKNLEKISLYYYQPKIDSDIEAEELLAKLKSEGSMISFIIDGMPVCLLRKKDRGNTLGNHIRGNGINIFFDQEKDIDWQEVKRILRHELVHAVFYVLRLQKDLAKGNFIYEHILANFLDEFFAYITDDSLGGKYCDSEFVAKAFFYLPKYEKEPAIVSEIEKAAKIWSKILKKIVEDKTGILSNKVKYYLIRNAKRFGDIAFKDYQQKDLFLKFTGMNLDTLPQ